MPLALAIGLGLTLASSQGVPPGFAFSFTYNGQPFTFAGAVFTYGAPA